MDVEMHWVRLVASSTVMVRYAHRLGAEPAFESVTMLSLAGPARVWMFDTQGFVPDEPGVASVEGDELTVGRRSPRGTNRTSYALQKSTGALLMAVGFTGAGEGAMAMRVAEARLKRQA